jgi:hypothetical protein
MQGSHGQCTIAHMLNHAAVRVVHCQRRCTVIMTRLFMLLGSSSQWYLLGHPVLGMSAEALAAGATRDPDIYLAGEL